MAEAERRVVQPNPDGGWDVTAPGATRKSAHTDTQQEGINRAREILEHLGGGELETRGRDGRIRAVDTIPPGNDPTRSKG